MSFREFSLASLVSLVFALLRGVLWPFWTSWIQKLLLKSQLPIETNCLTVWLDWLLRLMRRLWSSQRLQPLLSSSSVSAGSSAPWQQTRCLSIQDHKLSFSTFSKVKVQSLSALSSVVKEFPGKFADASKFGAIMWVFILIFFCGCNQPQWWNICRKDVGKCEARYKCDLQVRWQKVIALKIHF